jgi:bifunctional DNA-binding transcriptional regulator/antitoxin component of YhaV-PrlF toxin-antitoxin module
MVTDLVKMSPKGQLVVPLEIREQENFQPGDRFVAFPTKEGVLFKKIRIPDIKAEFDKVSMEITTHFKKHKIAKKDVKEAIKWARKKSCLTQT